ncbi:cation transport regulator ChaB [Frankia sp. CcI49]|uniref:ChaB family protein n=1 Tax=unclassified Frankia TaxID=2632575 RepID=UPI0006CA5012|nr:MULTISPECIES: ChaB family protein [unclassified Frankia]KPM56085.1 cation transport regulator ChaB [Frankia sp. R43]ONH50787.1 cation transport regulator ChaB [Frankia sp. CcI49]
MISKKQQAQRARSEVPSTVARSDDKAVRTWKKTHDSAVETYGEGERAHRAAFASLKHTHEKTGDHWQPKAAPGPSDEQAAKPTRQALRHPSPTAEGVDANASVAHLRGIARDLGIPGRSTMRKADLIAAIRKENRRATAAARNRSDS